MTRNALDLCRPLPGDIAEFCARVSRHAERDFENGVKTRPTGRELARIHAEYYRMGHTRLAATVYGQTIWAIEAAIRDLEQNKTKT